MPDLVIGSRRYTPQRALRAVVMLVGLVVTAFVVAYFIYRRSVAYDIPDGQPSRSPVVLHQPTPGAAPMLRWDDATLAMLGDLAVLRASGEPFTIGAAHGRLLASWLPAVGRSLAPTIDGIAGSGGTFGRWTRGMRKDWRLRFVDNGFTGAAKKALAGLLRGARASGVDLDYADLLRQEAALDLGVPAPWSAEADHRGLTRALTIVAPQTGGTASRLWVGHELALPGTGDGGDAMRPVVSLIRPAGKLAWAGVGWPGMLGVVTGINAEGVVVIVHPVRTRDVRPTRTARPIAVLARDVLEQAHDLDEAVKLIEATATLGAAAYVIVDGQKGTWAVVERGPSRVAVRRQPAAAAVGDLLEAEGWKDDPENDRTQRISASPERVARALQLLQKPPADAAAVAAILRDRRGLDGEGLPVGHRGAIDDAAAVQVVLFDPGSLAMWVGDGPGAGARLRAFDLRHELRGEGDRPVPPADIPADPDADPQ
ncbi:MAG TPA: C45 family autoproteolytic acyltransferase/hydrolase, partial [Kofleriaceae bacterium]|nr:C45 family autoproteolytic acyltransferase/hydrolase [Kofleriaceae bacterium]